MPKYNSRIFIYFFIFLFLICSFWFLSQNIELEIKVVMTVYSLSLFFWIFTKINDSYISLAAITLLIFLNIIPSDNLFNSLGNELTWFLISAFILSHGFMYSGLIEFFMKKLYQYQKKYSVKRIFLYSSMMSFLTVFVMPSTTGRALLLSSYFSHMDLKIGDKKIVKSISMIIPIVILQSAFCTLTGAGSHLIAAGIIESTSSFRFTYLNWLLYSFPYGILSTILSVMIVFFFYLNKKERNSGFEINSVDSHLNTDKPINKLSILVYLLVFLLWCTENYHGINKTVIAIAGVIFLCSPLVKGVNFKKSVNSIEWSLIIFMSCIFVLTDALNNTGATTLFIDYMFGFIGNSSSKIWFFIFTSGIGLLSHFIISSRSARIAIILPIGLGIAKKIGVDLLLTTIILCATTGYCLSLPVSAKSVAIFSQLSKNTFSKVDLLKISLIIIPLQFLLTFIFIFVYWPFVGLDY